jgi:hypothetical protein
MSALEVLRRLTSALDRAGITYMLTGSFASAHHEPAMGSSGSFLSGEMDFQVKLKAGMEPC